MQRTALAGVGVTLTLLAAPASAREIFELWNFSDPAASERAFRDELASARGDSRLELLTQVARTYGLRGRFDDAHRLLDEIEPQLRTAGAAPRVRYLLERGRAFRSGGAPERARPLFVEAWELARTKALDGLAVDAAHMVALVEQSTDEQLAWNARALALAERSQERYARSWRASLHNNIGWSLHEAGRFEEALSHFEAAVRERLARGEAERTRHARWSLARCLRSLERFDEALRIQRALEAEHAALAAPDGYVFEELAELLEATGKPDEAKSYYARAAAELGKDSRFVKNESARLQRLRAKGGNR